MGPLINLTLQAINGDESLATISGALLPGARLHVESYKSWQASKSNRLLMLTPAMFIFIAALALASDNGSKSVYGLAIDDAPEQHRRLVAYLRRFGGHPLKRVDDSLASVPDRILYGGFGTIIKGDVADMLERGLAMVNRYSN